MVSDIVTRAHSDPSERSYTFERLQDVEDIVEGNKALQGEAQRSDFGRHVARVPMVIIERWLNEEAARGHRIQFLSHEFNAWFDRKIREPDNRAWRVDNPSNPFHSGWR
jgi:hypothetical protein